MSVTEVNNVQTTANKPGYLKRAGMVCSPIVPGIIRFGKSLVDGQNIYDAAKTVKQEYKAVHEANKQDLHKAAEFRTAHHCSTPHLPSITTQKV